MKINEQYYIKEDMSDLQQKSKFITVIKNNDEQFTFTCKSDNESVIYVINNVCLSDVCNVFSSDIIDYVYALSKSVNCVELNIDDFRTCPRKQKYHNQSVCYVDKDGYVSYTVSCVDEYIFFNNNEIDVYSELSDEQTYAIIYKMNSEHYEELFILNIHYNDCIIKIYAFDSEGIIDIITQIYSNRAQSIINSVNRLYVSENGLEPVNESILSDFSIRYISNQVCHCNSCYSSFFERLKHHQLFEKNTDETFGIIFRKIVRLVKKYSHDIEFIYELMNNNSHSKTITTDCFFHYEYDDDHNKHLEVSKKKRKNAPKDEHPIIIIFKYSEEADEPAGQSVRALDAYSKMYDASDLYKYDPLILVFNLAHITSLNSIEETVTHELTHALEQFGTDNRDVLEKPKKQFYKSLKDNEYKMTGSFSSVKNDFSYNSDIVFKIVKNELYVLNPYEQNSFIEETSVQIRYKVSKKMFNSIKKKCNDDIDIIKDVLIRQTFTNNRLSIMNALIEHLDKDVFDYYDRENVCELCMLGYYINKHHYREIHKNSISKEFIEQLMSDDVDLYNDALNKELKGLRYTIFNIIKHNVDEYSNKLEKEVDCCVRVLMEKYKKR